MLYNLHPLSEAHHMKYISVILFSLATLIAVPSFSADEAHLKQLLETNECEKCDLSGADLKGKNLFRANLFKANLKDANLEDAKLEGANLKYANLKYANLERANLFYATLSYADLSRANLKYTDLSGANSEGVNLSGANLSDAVFSESFSNAKGLILCNTIMWDKSTYETAIINSGCGTDKKKSSPVQNSKIIECKMVTAFNTNGTMREKEYFRINNGNIEYNKWNFKKKRGEWLKTNKKSDGKFKWFVKRPYNLNNLSNTFKLEFDLEIDINMENILLKALARIGQTQRYSSKGKCKIYKG